ncbi:hypothetical protein CL635_00190 [bacterium]|jgi:hypothetical protein|nr:hypothetical protein [bacterium]|tara:strand:+ start:24512 stop:24856 length:345 start_codon:yes stop_codon:yes gene_type:complete
MKFAEYFENLDAIENKWRELKNNDFSQKLRDELWGLCMKGKTLFWKMAEDDMRKGYGMVSTVPAYQRAIMLLEHEGRFEQAVEECRDAQKWKINTDWYEKRIEKLQKLIQKKAS